MSEFVCGLLVVPLVISVLANFCLLVLVWQLLGDAKKKEEAGK